MNVSWRICFYINFLCFLFPTKMWWKALLKYAPWTNKRHPGRYWKWKRRKSFKAVFKRTIKLWFVWNGETNKQNKQGRTNKGKHPPPPYLKFPDANCLLGVLNSLSPCSAFHQDSSPCPTHVLGLCLWSIPSHHVLPFYFSSRNWVSAPPVGGRLKGRALPFPVSRAICVPWPKKVSSAKHWC